MGDRISVALQGGHSGTGLGEARARPSGLRAEVALPWWDMPGRKAPLTIASFTLPRPSPAKASKLVLLTPKP